MNEKSQTTAKLSVRNTYYLQKCAVNKECVNGEARLEKNPPTGYMSENFKVLDFGTG